MNYFQSLSGNILKYIRKMYLIFINRKVNTPDIIPANPKNNYIANLVKLAFADNILHEAEIDFIYKVAKRIGLDFSLVEAIIKQPRNIEYDLPKDETTQYSFINDILNLISVDGNIDDNEVLAIKKITEKLNFDQAIVDDIISKIKTHLEEGFDQNRINEIIQNGIHPSTPKSDKYESIIYNTLTLLGLNFKHFKERDRTYFKLGLTLENGRAISIIDVKDLLNQVNIYILCLSGVPPHKMEMISEFINLVNEKLKFGNFEMDFSDGEVRHKYFYSFDNNFLDGDIIFKEKFLKSCNMMDKYLPGLMSIIYSKVTPSDAFTQIDNF